MSFIRIHHSPINQPAAPINSRTAANHPGADNVF